MTGARCATLLLMSGLLLGGSACASRKVLAPEVPGQALVVLLPDPETGHVGRAVVSNAAGRVELNAARASTVVSTKGSPAAVTALGQSDVHGIFGETLAALPPAPRNFTLFFRFDSEDLTDESRALAPEILRAVKSRQVPEVFIVGHTDTMGTRSSNFELGLRRANRVRTILLDAGLNPSLIDLISHGESELLVPTRDGIVEARNRRVEIAVR